MEKLKKSLSLLLALTMLVGLLPTAALATETETEEITVAAEQTEEAAAEETIEEAPVEEAAEEAPVEAADEAEEACISVASVSSGVTASGTCGNNVSWVLDDSGTLTISGSGAMDDGVSFSDSSYADEIVSVVIENSVTSIGSNAFSYCTNLTSVQIGSGVTSIGESAFEGCSSLQSVDIPGSVKTVGAQAFYNCTNLASLTIGDGVTTISNRAFWECYGLTSVVIPDSVTSIGSYVFDGAGLTSADIGSGVTSIGEGAFYRCTSLVCITVDADNPVYSSVDGVVFNKAGTELLIFPAGWDGTYTVPDSVVTIGESAFYQCVGLTGITLGSHVTSIGSHAFGSCYSLEYATLPDTLTSIGDSAFEDCECLADITIPSSVVSIGTYAFAGCESLTGVVIPEGVTKIACGAFTSCRGLVSVTLPKSVTEIEASAFVGYNLKDVYYAGSESDWAAISIDNEDESNEYLLNATIHYNSTGPDDVEEHTHTYGTPTWNWNGTSSATAKFTCTDGNDTQTVKAAISYKVTKAATTTSTGTGTYTASATFNGKTYTNAKTVTIAKVTLSTPKLTGISNATTGVTVTWNKVSGTAKYRVFRKTSGGSWTRIAVTNSTSYTDKTAKSGTTYYYTVRCITSDEKSYTSSYDKTGLSIKYLSNGTISSLTNTSKGVTVKWSKVSGASGYYVYRKTGSGSYSRIATIKSGSTVSYTDTAVKSKNGTTYTYAVRAYSGSTRGAYTGKTTVRLTAPTLSSVKNSSSKKLTVKWKKVSSVTGYQIEYSTSKSFSNSTTVKVSSASSVSKTISSLKKGKTYYVRVRTYKTVSGTSYYSAWSSTKSVKVKK